MPEIIQSLDLAVDRILAAIDGPLHVGAPLGLGKPHRLLNALYGRIGRDPGRRLHLYTALSLDPPDAGSDLERRFMAPFVARHFGEDFPRLDYVQALKRDALPAHVEVEEFYEGFFGLPERRFFLGSEDCSATLSAIFQIFSKSADNASPRSISACTLVRSSSTSPGSGPLLFIANCLPPVHRLVDQHGTVP